MSFWPTRGHISTPKGLFGPLEVWRALEVLERPHGRYLVPTVTDLYNWVGNIDVMCSGTSTVLLGLPEGIFLAPKYPFWGRKKFRLNMDGHVCCPERRNSMP